MVDAGPTATVLLFCPRVINRRTLLSSGLLGLVSVTLAACSTTTEASSTATSAAAGGPPSGGPGGAGGMGASAETAAATALAADVASSFTQHSYADAASGKSLPYNVFLPDGYSASKSYPLVLYIADSSLVGQAVTAPLNQYGALIWASAAEQAKRKAIVVVPEFPEIILDDHSSHTTTAYVELTARFVTWLQTKYAVDANRVYGTGQSMGCMTVMLLTAEHPDLFTAELFVSGQWEASKLAGLTKARFVFIAAGGDTNASGGQADVKKILTNGGVAYSAAELDATWSDARIEAAAKTLLARRTRDSFFSFKTGTVLTANPTAGGLEHMASFEPAYKITAARDWLFRQTR
jgi:predicted peptidase